MYRLWWIGTITLVFSAFTAVPVSAATIGFGETYTLAVGTPVPHNLYVAAGTAILSGQASRDVTAAAGDITLSGPVSGSALLAGGTVEVLGPVSGSVRAVGGKLTIADRVGGDSVLAGGLISLLSGAETSGDALLAGGRISLLGSVLGSAYVLGGDVFIDGTVSGDLHVYSKNMIHLGPHTVVMGNFIYRSPQPATIDSGALIKGKTTFDPVPPLLSAHDARGFFAGLFGVAFVLRLLMVLASALLFVLVFRRMSMSLASLSLESFWKMVLLGLAVFAGVPFASLIIAFTVFGGLITVVMLALWVLLLVVAQAYSGVIFALAIRKYLLHKELAPVVSWQMVTLGVLGLGVVFLVPYIGVLIFLLFSLSALGALSTLAYRHFLSAR